MPPEKSCKMKFPLGNDGPHCIVDLARVDFHGAMPKTRRGDNRDFSRRKIPRCHSIWGREIWRRSRTRSESLRCGNERTKLRSATHHSARNELTHDGQGFLGHGFLILGADPSSGEPVI